MLDMRLSARADYALRAAIELAATERNHITAEQLARAQDIPGKFLEAILTQLRRAGLVRSQRGPEGGFWLARPAEEISMAASSGPSTDRSSGSGANAPRKSATSGPPNRCSRSGSRCAPTSAPSSKRSPSTTSCP